MKAYKTFYSVEYTSLGMFGTRTAYFDNKKDAYKFANNDYRDKPVAHRFNNPVKIARMEELVKDTNYEFCLEDA